MPPSPTPPLRHPVGSDAAAASVAAEPVRATPVRGERFALNLVANVGQLALSMVVGAWYVPFLVHHLSAAVYGLVPLASSITNYMVLLTVGLDSAVFRYLAIALGRKDDAGANLVFNVSFWSNLVLSMCLLVPATIAIVQIHWLIHIPAGYVGATRWLFAGTVATFLLNQITIPFGVCCYCRNRLDLQNLVGAAETLTRVGLVAALFWLLGPRVELVGAAIVAGTLVSSAGMLRLWRVLTPNLRLRLGLFDWGMLRALYRTGGWVIVSQLGMMLFLNIDLLLANRLFGAEACGHYAAVLQLPLLMRTAASAVAGVFVPTVLQLYAQQDADALVSFLNRSVKFVGLLMALPIGLIGGFSEPLLRLWLGPGYSSLAPLLSLMVIPLCLTLAMHPLYNLPLATNHVKVPGLATCLMGAGNLALALLLAGVLGWGLYGLAAAGAVMLTLRYSLFIPWYGARILGRAPGTFFRSVAPVLAATLATIGLSRLILWCWRPANWLELGLAGASVTALFVLAVQGLLTREERQGLKEMLAQLRDKFKGGDGMME